MHCLNLQYGSLSKAIQDLKTIIFERKCGKLLPILYSICAMWLFTETTSYVGAIRKKTSIFVNTRNFQIAGAPSNFSKIDVWGQIRNQCIVKHQKSPGSHCGGEKMVITTHPNVTQDSCVSHFKNDFLRATYRLIFFTFTLVWGSFCPPLSVFFRQYLGNGEEQRNQTWHTFSLGDFTWYIKNCRSQVRSPGRIMWLNPRPAGPSPTPALCWGAVAPPPPPSILVTNRRGGKIQPAMESPGRDLSDAIKKFDPESPVTSQVRSSKMFDISI